jgi:CRP/FNR family transcriptional regulator
VTNFATETPPKPENERRSKQGDINLIARQIGSESPVRPPPPQNNCLPRPQAASAMTCDAACRCRSFNQLCGDADGAMHPAGLGLSVTVHTIPARRLIRHPKECSDFVPIICSGWAMSAVALADGRSQIISFLLPGDIVSAGSLMAPMSGYTVQAITEVTYRNFKRDEIMGLLLGRPELLEKMFGLWSEDKARADQLALDLGRRRAAERIARLILRLADKVAKRTTVRNQTFDFPLRQRHIADATGLTPVHVSKVLRELQRAGLIEINGGSLTITNEAELQRLSHWR